MGISFHQLRQALELAAQLSHLQVEPPYGPFQAAVRRPPVLADQLANGGAGKIGKAARAAGRAHSMQKFVFLFR